MVGIESNKHIFLLMPPRAHNHRKKPCALIETKQTNMLTQRQKTRNAKGGSNCLFEELALGIYTWAYPPRLKRSKVPCQGNEAS
ncbi:hypothetical protein E2562_024201, partial [Oryza meyeriana var. granulata]